jgi:hypothetical protein
VLFGEGSGLFNCQKIHVFHLHFSLRLRTLRAQHVQFLCTTSYTMWCICPCMNFVIVELFTCVCGCSFVFLGLVEVGLLKAKKKERCRMFNSAQKHPIRLQYIAYSIRQRPDLKDFAPYVFALGSGC